MTATNVGDKGGNEERRIEQLKFVTNDSKISSSFDPKVPLEEVDTDVFMDKSRSDRARSIWCEVDQ